jgi:hypothetical protein
MSIGQIALLFVLNKRSVNALLKKLRFILSSWQPGRNSLIAILCAAPF